MNLISSNTKYHQGNILYVKETYEVNDTIIKFYKETSITFDDFSNHFKKYKDITKLDCSWRREKDVTIFEVEKIKTTRLETLEFITEARKMLTAILPKLKENQFIVSDILPQNIGIKNNKFIFIDESKFKEENDISKQLIHFAVGAWRMVEIASYENISMNIDYVKNEINLFEKDLKEIKL